MIDLNKIQEVLDSEDFQNKLDEYVQKHNEQLLIQKKQLKRFHLKFEKKKNFSKFVDKVIEKYSSDKYRNHWRAKMCEPPETLFWFLFYYAEKYGRECSLKEWRKYGNTFTSSLYYIKGYYFNKMDGQGSCIIISKK